jgi:hypothetical protein
MQIEHVSATEGHHHVYMMICVNWYTILQYCIAREVSAPEKCII